MQDRSLLVAKILHLGNQRKQAIMKDYVKDIIKDFSG